MKQIISTALLAILLLLSAGCSETPPDPIQSEPQAVAQVGQVPEAFRQVVETNAFSGATAFDGRLLKSDILSGDKENRTVSQRVRMMDLYGETLAVYQCDTDDAYHITTLTATQDGGFLFVLGFQDRAYGTGEWASDAGFASHVIKCDSQGNVEFDAVLNGIEGTSLDYCFEQNGQFFFFGEIQTAETDKQGVSSPTDISMIILDETGKVLKQEQIGGSDYDSLDAVETTAEGFLLSISAQSDDGDFAGSNSKGYPVDWTATVNGQLEIIEKKKATGRDFFDQRIGQRNGAPVYPSDPLLDGFDAGTPTAFIDYGDFYLIVSENITGEYESPPPTISSIWYYSETVYSAYDDTGALLFRASVDSSPDYDAWISEFQQGMKSVS